MRVLVITQYFWPENFRINDVVQGLSSKGVEVEVLTGIPNYPDGKVFEGYDFFSKRIDDFYGIKVYRVPLVPRGNSSKFRLISNFISFAVAASLRSTFFSRYDIIFVYEPSPITVGIPALWLKLIKKIPIIFWVQDLWPESLETSGEVKNKYIINLIDFFVQKLYKNCDRILISSKGFKKRILKQGVQADKIEYYPNFVENFFTEEINYKKIDTLPNGFKIMFTGNIGFAQDFETILQAANILKNELDIYWVIVGSGRRSEWLKSEIIRLGLTDVLKLEDRQPIEVIPNYFANSDVLILNLQNRKIFSLTVPSKLQAYMTASKPIIAGLDGDGAEIVQEAECGFVCKPKDIDALVNAVKRMYSMSQDERIRMGLNAKNYYNNNFDREMLLNKLISNFENIVSTKTQ